MENDPRCESPEDEEIIRTVAEYGWYVFRVVEKDETPSWAFSVGLYENFIHPEVVVFGLNPDVLHYVIESVGVAVRSGKRFEVDGMYPDLIDPYSCTFKPVHKIWYHDFLGYANWFYQGHDYPALQLSGPIERISFLGIPSSILTGFGVNHCYSMKMRRVRERSRCWNRWQSKTPAPC